MSGGASLGAYHVGVVYQLYRENLLPKVITGSSVGSIIASLICCLSDAEFEASIANPQILNLTFFEKKRPVGLLGKVLIRTRYVLSLFHCFCLGGFLFSFSMFVGNKLFVFVSCQRTNARCPCRHALPKPCCFYNFIYFCFLFVCFDYIVFCFTLLMFLL